MNEPQIFLPATAQASPAKNIVNIVIFFLLMSAAVMLPIWLSAKQFMPYAAVILAVYGIYFLFKYKHGLSVIVDTQNKSLQYEYVNGFGIKGLSTVSLPAQGYYRSEILNRTSTGWRLLLYNNSYFNNRVDIKENYKGGYSKEQLDQIMALVRQCK